MSNVRGGTRLLCTTVVAVALLALTAGPAMGFAKAMWGPGFRNGVSLFPTFRQLGVSILRGRAGLGLVAPTRPHKPTNPNDPAYQWPADLREIDQAANRFHIRVMLQLDYTPAWANGGDTHGWAPLHPGDVADFATAVARHYPSVHLWMVWGEPNREGHFDPIVRAKPYQQLTLRSKWRRTTTRACSTRPMGR